jgi:hypothetical protein
LKRFRKSFKKQIEDEIRMIAPKARIEYLKRPWLVRGKLKDPWQDIKVSNITVSESFLIAMRVIPEAVTWKG